MDEEYLTVAEVAALLKLNQQTVRNWIDASSLPAVRVGRRVRIKRSDVEAMVDRGYTAKPAVEPDAEARRRLGQPPPPSPLRRARVTPSSRRPWSSCRTRRSRWPTC